MERVDEMLLLVADEMDSKLLLRQQEMMDKIYPEHFDHLKDVLQHVCSLAVEKEKCSTVISFLRSSYITRSHKFKIAVYSGEPFVELNPSYENDASLAVFFEAATEQDIQDLIKKVGEKYIRITAAEKEEIRRAYMEKLYRGSIIVFQALMKDDTVQMHTDIKVYFGEEMGELIELERI